MLLSQSEAIKKLWTRYTFIQSAFFEFLQEDDSVDASSVKRLNEAQIAVLLRVSDPVG